MKDFASLIKPGDFCQCQIELEHQLNQVSVYSDVLLFCKFQDFSAITFLKAIGGQHLRLYFNKLLLFRFRQFISIKPHFSFLNYQINTSINSLFIPRKKSYETFPTLSSWREAAYPSPYYGLGFFYHFHGFLSSKVDEALIFPFM